MENNNLENVNTGGKGKKIYIILLVVFVLISVALSGYIVYDKVLSNDKTEKIDCKTKQEDKNVQDESIEENNNEGEYNNEVTVKVIKEDKTDLPSSWEAFVKERESEREMELTIAKDDFLDEDDDYKFVLTTDGRVLLTARFLDSYEDDEEKSRKEYNNKEIFKDVILYANLRAGFSDMCNGNEHLIVVKKDGSVSSVDLDRLECGKTLSIKENIPGLKNIIGIYGVNVNESMFLGSNVNRIYAKDIDGKVMDITEYFSIR